MTDVAQQSWREDAACLGSPHDFVDVAGVEVAEYLIRRYCHRCPVLSACAEYGVILRPEKWTAIYGGRLLWAKPERKARAS